MTTPRKIATCTAWKATFGFLVDAEGNTFFAHQTGVRAPGESFRCLIPGERYSFEIKPSSRGPCAVDIQPCL